VRGSDNVAALEGILKKLVFPKEEPVGEEKLWGGAKFPPRICSWFPS
jgi:hypothetical protein